MTDRSDRHEKAALDRQMTQIRAGAEYSGWQFRIVDESATHVVYESRPPGGLRWRRVAASIGVDGKVRLGSGADVGAVRAWRRLPKTTRKALMAGKRTPETSEEASVALEFARFALSGTGLVSAAIPLMALVVAATLGLAAIGNGLGTPDYIIIAVAVGGGWFRHFHVYRRLRASAGRVLHPTD
jgi:hypothetical protein